MGATKTYANAKRLNYWPRMFDWICALTVDCLTCRKNKQKPKHRNEVPLEEWQSETVPFRTVHTDHKGHSHPTSANNVHCLLIIDAFSRFLMVYPVRNTTTLATIAAVEKWILSFGIPQSIIKDRGTALINTEFVNWFKELGITVRPRTALSSWTNGKKNPEPTYCSKLAKTSERCRKQLVFASTEVCIRPQHKCQLHNWITPYEIVFGTKPQIPMSFKLGLYQNKDKFCCSNFCKDLPLILIARTAQKKNCWTTYLNRNYHKLS